MTYKVILTGALGLGFLTGWLSGVFLALWAAFTLGML